MAAERRSNQDDAESVATPDVDAEGVTDMITTPTGRIDGLVEDASSEDERGGGTAGQNGGPDPAPGGLPTHPHAGDVVDQVIATLQNIQEEKRVENQVKHEGRKREGGIQAGPLHACMHACMHGTTGIPAFF